MKKTINIGIVAHVDAGKTTITENLLYCSGAIKSVGRVDLGNTQTDSMELERKRGITIKSSTSLWPIYHQGGFNCFVAMAYMRAKSASSGKSAPIFIAWPQKVGKKVIHANPKLFQPYLRRNRKLSKFPMPGPSCANKVEHGYYRKSMKLTRLFAQNAREQCRLWR